MNRTRTLLAATTAAAALALAGCGYTPAPEYEPAEPVGTGEQCFSIERATPTEEELGIYCLPGVDPADVRTGAGDDDVEVDD